MLTITSRHFWELFVVNLGFNIKSEVSRTYLGYLWWLLEPVFYVGAMYVVLGIFLGRRSEGFMLFLVLGQVPFSWFSRSVTNASGSIWQGKSLIQRVSIPKVYFPLLTISQDLVKQLVVFAATLIFIALLGQDITLTWLALPAIVITQFILILAVSLVLASIVPAIPDFKFLISTAMMVLMWGSGIFYSIEDVLLEKHRHLFLLNPVANLIKNYRQVILDNSMPDWVALGTILLVSLLVIAVMLEVFRRNDTAFARLVIE